MLLEVSKLGNKQEENGLTFPFRKASVARKRVMAWRSMIDGAVSLLDLVVLSDQVGGLCVAERRDTFALYEFMPSADQADF